MRKTVLLVLLAITAARIFGQDSYENPEAGFSFSYPEGTKLYQAWIPEMKAPDDFFIFVFTEPIPVRAEINLGYDLLNIPKVKAGLEQGKIDGMPFYYRKMSELVQIKGGHAIINYAFSWYAPDNILFEIRIIFFSGDNINSIWISAEAHHDEIIDHYKDKFFEKKSKYWFWKYQDNENFLTGFKDLVKNGDIPVFEKWMDIVNTISSTLQTGRPKK